MKKYKSRLGWLLIAALCFVTVPFSIADKTTAVKAEETTQSNQNPQIVLEDGVLSIQGVTTVTSETLADIDLQEIQRIVFGNDVKKIAEGVFENCNNLEDITWGGVTLVGKYAFAGCKKLDMMTMCAANNVGSYVKNIGEGAFWGCDKIRFVDLPELEKIGKNAFPLETDLLWENSFNMPVIEEGFWNQRTGTMLVTNNSNWDDIIEENSQEKIEWEKRETTASSITYRRQMGENGEEKYDVDLERNTVCRVAADGNAVLETCDANSGVFCIGESIPASARHLTIKVRTKKIQFQLVQRTDEESDVEDSNLQSIKIVGAVTIKDDGFSGNTALEEFEAEKILSIGERAFQGCTSLKKISIKNGAESIGESAFERCTNLTDVVIGKKLITIEKRVFYGCKKLQHVELPTWVRKIKKEAFGNCPALKSIILSENVMHVGLGNFESTDIYWKGSEVEFGTPGKGENEFLKQVTGTMFVPADSAFWQAQREKYPEVHWKSWTPVIEPVETETYRLMDQVYDQNIVSTEPYVDEEGLSCVKINFTGKYQSAAFRLPEGVQAKDYAAISIKAKVGGQLMFDLVEENISMIDNGEIGAASVVNRTYPFYYEGEEGETKYGTEDVELNGDTGKTISYMLIGNCRGPEEVEMYDRKYEFYIYSVTFDPIDSSVKKLVFEGNASPKSSQAPTTQPSESSSSPTKEPFPTASFSPAQEPLENPTNPADASMTSPTQKTEKTTTNIPSLSLKKKKRGKLRYIQVTIKSSTGRYFDLYMKKKGKKYTRVRLKKTTLKKGRQVVKLIYAKKSGTVYFKVRTYDVSKGRKRYGAYSKEKWVKW